MRHAWQGFALICSLYLLLPLASRGEDRPPRPILAGDIIIAFKPGTDAEDRLRQATRTGADPTRTLAPIISDLERTAGVPLLVKQLLGGQRVLLAIDCGTLLERLADHLRGLSSVAKVESPIIPAAECFRPGRLQILTMEFKLDSEEHRALVLSQGQVPPALREALARAVDVPHGLRRDEQARVVVTLDGPALTFRTVDRLKTIPELDSAQPNYLMKFH